MSGDNPGACFTGKVVGSYTLCEILGKGSFGTVYKATDSHGANFAIKVIPNQGMMDENKKPTQKKELLDQEVQIMRLIRHPKLVRLREKLQSGNNYYLVLDYCEDGDLNQYLKNGGAMQEGDAIDAIKQLALGFQELHRLGIMHRDFKPANVFIHKGNFIIGDLGMAKQASYTCTMVGTKITMAPEVQEGLGRKYDSTVDLFSLGVTFYYMLYRQWPWKLTNLLPIDMRTKVGPKLEFPDNDNVSAESRGLLRGMIALRQDRLNWPQFFQLLDKLNVPGGLASGENQTFNDMLFKLGVKQSEADEKKSEPPHEDVEVNFEAILEKISKGLDPQLLAVIQLIEKMKNADDSNDMMKKSDVKFWFGQMEHNRNMIRFYLGHCDYLKQVWKERASLPAGFGDLILQLGMALIHKSQLVLHISEAFITQKIISDDHPKIDNYLKTSHSKTVLADLEKFKAAVQGNRASLISKVGMEAKEQSTNNKPDQNPWVELIILVELSKSSIKDINEYCKNKLQLLLTLIPHIDSLSSEDFKHPVTSKLLVCFLRIYQMVYDDEELPKPRAAEVATEWNQFFKKSITVEMLKTNFYKAKGRL
jgi:serine/threonine protein kinase